MCNMSCMTKSEYLQLRDRAGGGEKKKRISLQLTRKLRYLKMLLFFFKFCAAA
jgi:hypothetical protein